MKSIITPSHFSMERLLLRKDKGENRTKSLSLLYGVAFNTSGCVYNPYVALQVKLNNVVGNTALSQIGSLRASQAHASVGHGVGFDFGDMFGINLTWGLRTPWNALQPKVFVSFEPYATMGLNEYSSNYGGNYTLVGGFDETKFVDTPVFIPEEARAYETGKSSTRA